MERVSETGEASLAAGQDVNITEKVGGTSN